MIYSPDPLRQQVEKQSNGQRTIIYSPKGQPNYVFIVPRFNLETIDKNLGSGIHPAFIVNNKAIDAFFLLLLFCQFTGWRVSEPT